MCDVLCPRSAVSVSPQAFRSTGNRRRARRLLGASVPAALAIGLAVCDDAAAGTTWRDGTVSFSSLFPTFGETSDIDSGASFSFDESEPFLPDYKGFASIDHVEKQQFNIPGLTGNDFAGLSNR